MRKCYTTTCYGIDGVETEINYLLSFHKDAQIVSVIKENTTSFGCGERYKLVAIIDAE